MRAQDASTSIYYRTDSDQTTVVTPRLRVGANVGSSTRLDVTYSVDVWTSASVDVRASASKPIVEQRDEIIVAGSHTLSQDVTLNASYRYSSEPDYKSNGGSLGLTTDLADHNTTLSVNAGAYFDAVGRAGDPVFWKAAHTFTGRVGLVQVLTPSTIAQALYEINRSEGFLSSPYRRIGIRTPTGYCSLPSQPQGTTYDACIPESDPPERMRHALAVRARQALSSAISLGAGYRFYFDDWQLSSHTMDADLGYSPDDSWVLGLRYRFYLQGAAAQYRAYWKSPRAGAQYYNHDKELSPFNSHRVGFDAEHTFTVDSVGTKLHVIASLARTLYLYSNFPTLSSITAYESTIVLGVEW